MKSSSRFARLLLTASLALLALPAPAQEKEWEKIPRPALRPFQPQQPKRIALPNGIVLFLQEDHELPLIHGWLFLRGGSRDEAAAKVGLMSIYGQAWRTGGTKTRTGDQLDEFLEARGALVETGEDEDSTNIFWSSLTGDFEGVFAASVDLLQNPEFREDKITLAKQQENTGISRRNDNFMGIAAREAAKLAYGAGHPYARHTEYATVAAVTRQDLLDWHQKSVHAGNLIVAVLGDFDSKAMEAKLRQTFSSWKKTAAHRPPLMEFQGPKPGMYFIAKEDVNQSAIRMVDLGIRRDNPDYHAVEVMNEVFGGGFSARLFSNIRSRKGLAYTVGGGVGSDFDHPGLLQLQMTTKSGTTAESIAALHQEVEDLVGSKPASADELLKAKDAILNSFVFRFDTKREVLLEQIGLEYYGYPADFLQRYQAGISRVTVDDVNRVAKKYLHKNKLAVLVVGKAEDFDKPLSSFGPVTTIDVTIPEPAAAGGSAKGPAPTGSTAEGKALLAKVVEGLGGKARVDAVKAIRLKAAMVQKTPQGDMTIGAEALVAFPDRLRRVMQLPMGEVTAVVNGSSGFMTAMGMPRDLPPPMKEEMVKGLKREILLVAQQAENPKYVFSAGGSEKVGEVETRILDINADGAAVRWYVDPQSGRVLRMSSQVMEMSGPAQRVTDFSDWRTVDGITLPFKTSVTTNGEASGSGEALEVEFNPAVDPKLFEKPAEAAAGPPPG